MSSHVIARDDREGVALITIDRPEKSNALRAGDKAALAACLTDAANDKEIIGVVLTGAGDRSFCAGSDIEEMQAFSPAEMFQMLTAERAMYQAAIRSPKPVVAAVNGYAFGAGAITVMCCDYSVAASRSHLGTPELTIGVAAPLEGLLLPWIVGLGKARAMFFRAQRLTAIEALEAGLVHEVVPDDRCVARAIAVAGEMGSLPGRGFAIQKQVLGLLLETGNLEAAIQASHHATAGQFADPRTAGAMRRFLESRASRRSEREVDPGHREGG